MQRERDSAVEAASAVPGNNLSDGVLPEDRVARHQVTDHPAGLNLEVNPPPGPLRAIPVGNANHMPWEFDQAPEVKETPMGEATSWWKPRGGQVIIADGMNSFRLAEGWPRRLVSELSGLAQVRWPGDLQDWNAPH